MASSLSAYLAGKLTNISLRSMAFTPPAAVFIGLFTAEPGPNASGPEATYTGYARQAATFGEPSSLGKSLNTAKIDFPTNAGSTTQTVTHLVIFDAATGGNPLYIGDLSASKAIEPSDFVSFAVGTLSSTLEVRP